MSKPVLFQAIQFSVNTQFSYIWRIDRTQSSATTPGQSGSGSDINEGVYFILQSSNITETSPSNSLLHIVETCWYILPLQRCIRCILLPQHTGQHQLVALDYFKS